MKKKHICIKVITLFLLIISVISIFNLDSNVVYGEINKEYSTGETTGTIDVDKAVSKSSILGSIAHMLYAIAGFIEKTVGKIIGNFTGTNIFPWADKIIFNTIPFLDINFINPAAGSMFESKPPSPGGNGVMTAFGTIIGNMYYTIFTLAISFLGVVVGVMAIKLAISSIASEKAKYKSAIQNWLLALILVFTSHYLISFIFFVNEKMVEVASTLLIDRMNDVSFTIDVNDWTDEECQYLVDLLSDAMVDVTPTTDSSSGYFYSGNFTSVDTTFTVHCSYGIGNAIEFSGSNQKISNEYTKNLANKNLCILLVNKDYIEHKSFYDQSTAGFWENLGEAIQLAVVGNEGEFDEICSIMRDAARMTAEMLAQEPTNDLTTYLNHYYPNDPINPNTAKYAAANIYLNGGTGDEIITNMSTFFKNSVYTFKRDKNGKIASVSASEFAPIPAILYSIFVIQSIMYFIAYIKRFFYIIILALFAPLVIIYDFFTKSVTT